MIKAVDSNRDPLELTYRVGSGGRCSIHDLLSPIYEAIRDNGKSKSWKGIHGLCENFDRQNCNYPSDSESKIEESYFDLLQTDLKVKSKDDIKVKYWPNMLENHRTVDHHGIRPDETIHSIHRFFGGKPPQPAFNTDELDPDFDYDFNSVEDDGRRYMTGGFQYKRPYGWKRIAIKVLEKYGDDT